MGQPFRWQLLMQFSGRSFLLACVVVLLPVSARAQVVASMQPLNFGPLIGGVVEVVPPTDAARRGDISIQGTSNASASLSLVLPTALEAPDGATVPLQFLAGDLTYQQPAGGLVTVNVDGSTTIRLHRTRPGRLYIGGRALPAVGQTAGVYSATIVVVVAPAGA